MAKLALDLVHRAEGAAFTTDFGFELPRSYGDPLEEQRLVHRAAALIDRSYSGVLDLSGKEARKLLDSIFSSAVSRLSPRQGQLSTLLNAKGRLLAAFRLFALPDSSFRLVFFEPLHEQVLATMKKYAFLSDVTLTDRTPSVALLSLEGPLARKALAQVARGEPPGDLFSLQMLSIQGKDLWVARGGESPEGGFDLWAERPSIEDLWRFLLGAVRAVGGGPAGHEAAEALRIEAGLSRYGKDYDEECFPNEAGWESALTYDKCYVGQEVVARIKTYGHVNRRLEGLIFPDERLPPVGGPVLVNGEETGQVTSTALSARLGVAVALAWVKRKHWDQTARTVMVEGRPVEAKPGELPLVRSSG